jgi:hypothetical protein
MSLGMAGICSAHQKPDPSCRLCQTHPRELFPNWDAKVAEAKAAGTLKCRKCGFEFYLTTDMCPKCCATAKPEVLLAVSTCNLSLASEVLWFVNEWCKETGWMSPRMKNQGDGFVIHAFPPEKTDDESAEIVPARNGLHPDDLAASQKRRRSESGGDRTN